MKRLLVVAAVLAACSSAPRAELTLSYARVDATYRCPGGSVDARYDVHATIEARNATKQDVTIESATAEMVLASVTGAWIEKVGDRYDAGSVVVSPSTVAAGSTAKLEVTIPSSCTSGRSGSAQSSSGSYTVTVHLVTSAGAFTISAANKHEILAA